MYDKFQLQTSAQIQRAPRGLVFIRLCNIGSVNTHNNRFPRVSLSLSFSLTLAIFLRLQMQTDCVKLVVARYAFISSCNFLLCVRSRYPADSFRSGFLFHLFRSQAFSHHNVARRVVWFFAATDIFPVVITP